MEPQITICGKQVGAGYPAYIIAEMSANHAGSIERAKEIIRAAKEAGADCIKIQTYTPDTLTIDCDNKYFHIDQGTWEGENLYGLYGKAYTPWEWHQELKDEADRVGIDFLSTPFDPTAVDFLEELGLEFYKIASFEMVDLPLLKCVAGKGKPIIMSTGMATAEEIQEAVDTIFATGNHQLAILKCSSAYPARTDQMNLSTILDMKKRFEIPVGLSDHSLGSLSATTAVAMGASIIEKHFCISREIKNPDSSFSMTKEEFAQMVQDIRKVEEAKGQPFYGPAPQEEGSVIFRRSIFVVQDIKKGEAFDEKNVRIIRPGYGLMPREYEGLLGKKCLRDVSRGTPVTMDLIENYIEMIPAAPVHCQLLFGWANDPETRRQSFQSAEISWEEHIGWYEDSLQREDRKLFVAAHNTVLTGMYRLDFQGEEALIGYSVAPNLRKKGYGEAILRAGEELVKKEFPQIKCLKAFVKEQNTASAKLFEKLAYQEEQAPLGQLLFVKNL